MRLLALAAWLTEVAVTVYNIYPSTNSRNRCSTGVPVIKLASVHLGGCVWCSVFFKHFRTTLTVLTTVGFMLFSFSDIWVLLYLILLDFRQTQSCIKGTRRRGSTGPLVLHVTSLSHILFKSRIAVSLKHIIMLQVYFFLQYSSKHQVDAQ